MKICTKCHNPKQLDDFVKFDRSRDGRGSWCLLCFSEYMKARRRADVVGERASRKAYRQSRLEVMRGQDRERVRIRQAWVNNLKAKPCADCGHEFSSCCMDFDHVRGEMGIGEMLSFSKERVLEEVAKCDLVCACCHRVRTHPDRQLAKHPHRKRYYGKIDALKAKPCADCGHSFPPVAMDFDHVRGEKVATIAQMRSIAWSNVLVELAKCDLVCACCHRLRTHDRRLERAA